MNIAVEYTETITYVVEVEAETEEKAKQMVRDGYYDCEIPVTFGPRRGIKIAWQD